MKNFEENYNSFIMKFNLKSTIILFSVLFVTVATFAFSNKNNEKSFAFSIFMPLTVFQKKAEISGNT
mgnify:CR=1 FL=1